MKKMTTPIPGFGRYTLDIITQEILNKDGNSMKIRVDNRPGRGQSVVTLVKDDGKPTTINYRKMVRNTLEKQSFTPITTAILPRVLVCYYNRLSPEFEEKALSTVSREVSDALIDISPIDVGNILVKIHNNAKR